MAAMKITKNRILAVLFLAAALCLSISGKAAQAAENFDPSQSASLTVRAKDGEEAAEGASFRLYRVGNMNAQMEFSLIGDFAGYPVELNGLDSQGWRAAAQTLSAYVSKDQLTPLAQAATDTEGQAVFSELTPGLYLLTGGRLTIHGSRFTVSPALISLPQKDEGQWNYQVISDAKLEKDDNPPGPGTISRKVLKVWKNDSGRYRPTEISVQLLKDGQIYDTVVLNETNNWRHTWEGLDGDSAWQVAEIAVPRRYTVSVSQEGITFVMTNTYHTPDNPGGGDDNPPPEHPGNPPETPENPPEIPETPVNPSEEVAAEPAESLPQTGIPWWPVPLLAGAGLIALMVGWILWHREGK